MNTSLSTLEQRILEQIVELSTALNGQPVSHNAVLESLPEGTDLRDLNRHVRTLVEADFIRLDERFNGAWLAQPTDSGKAAWAEWEEARKSPRVRRRQLRDEYLIWLSDQHEEGLSPTPEEFLESNPSFLGVPYTQEDLERTGEWLLERGFIKGPMVWQRPDPIRPQITAKGQHYVDGGKSVHETPSAAGSTTFNNNIQGPAVLAQNSQHVTQTQNINAWKDDARALADAVAQLAPMVPDGSVLTSAATELRLEIDADARPGRVRELVDTVIKALGNGAGGALGSALITQAGVVLGSLPL